IENVVATYGENLGAVAGNATNNTSVSNYGYNDSPREQLTGKSTVFFGVDPNILGDPYPGQIKDFVVQWQCGRLPGINGAWVGPDSNGGLALVTCPPAVTGIQVQSASFGQNCGAPFGNETNTLVAACDGRNACDFVVDVGRIGDPAPGC